MEIKKSIKTIEQEVITYVAADGTEFKSKEECQAYEEAAKGYINAQYVRCFGKNARVDEGLTHEAFNINTYCGDFFYIFGGCCDDYIFALTFKSHEDVEAFHKYNAMHNSDYNFRDSGIDNIGDEVIGKTLIFRGYDSGWYCLGTKDELITELSEKLNIITHRFKCKDCAYYDAKEYKCTHKDRGEWWRGTMERLKGMTDPCDKFERA